jgi:hypothetical protein
VLPWTWREILCRCLVLGQRPVDVALQLHLSARWVRRRQRAALKALAESRWDSRGYPRVPPPAGRWPRRHLTKRPRVKAIVLACPGSRQTSAHVGKRSRYSELAPLDRRGEHAPAIAMAMQFR